MTTTKNTHTLQSKRDRFRPANLSIKIKASITIVAALLYVLAFPFLFSSTGAAGTALVILPVAVIGWVWGLWGGILAGLLAMPLNAILIELAGDHLTIRGSISGAITVLILGAVIGWLSDLLGRIFLQSQELALAHDQALEANRLKTVMLSKVSHELRTPLGAILGYAELLNEGTYGPVSEKQSQKLGSIIESSNELEILVSDLLDMSRIESGRLQLFFKQFSLADLVENVLSKTAVSTQEKGLDVTCAIEPTMPPNRHRRSDACYANFDQSRDQRHQIHR